MHTGEWHVLLEGPPGASYNISTGLIFFGRPDGSLWAVPFDPDGVEVRGEPVLVMDRAVAWAAIAESGTMVFGVPRGVRARQLTWVDRTGFGTPLEFAPRRYLHPRVSPDGRRVAVTIRERGGREAVWILDLARGTRTRLTGESVVNRWPVWTHDGTRITFVSSEDGASFDLFWKPVDGSGEARSLLTREGLLIPLSWSGQHQTLAYYEFGQSTTQADIWALPADGEPISVLSSASDERAPMFSPDGRWLAYVSDESGQDQVYVRPYPGPGAPVPISIEGGIEPVWSRAGDALYFRHEDRMMVVSVSAGETFGAPRELFRQSYAFSPIGRGNANFDAAADGRLLMVRDLPAEGGASPIHVVLNFLAEVNARMAR